MVRHPGSMLDLVAPAQARVDAARAANHRRSSEKRGCLVPPWETAAEREALDAFIVACPAGMTIDHVAPRSHPQIVGLHVIQNLAYMTREANGAKSNCLPEGMTPAEAVARGMAIWRKDVDADGTIHWERY